jgi:hypothetical protein
MRQPPSDLSAMPSSCDRSISSSMPHPALLRCTKWGQSSETHPHRVILSQRRCRASSEGRCRRSPSLPFPCAYRAANPEPRLLRRIAQTMPWDPLAVSVISRNPGGSRRRSWRARLYLSCRRCRRRCAPRHSGDRRETDETSEHHGNKTHVTFHPISIRGSGARIGLAGSISLGPKRGCSSRCLPAR